MKKIICLVLCVVMLLGITAGASGAYLQVLSINANTRYAIAEFSGELSGEVLTVNGETAEYTKISGRQYKITPADDFKLDTEYVFRLDGRYVAGIKLKSLLSDDFDDGITGWQNAQENNGALKIPSGSKAYYDGEDASFASQQSWQDYTVEFDLCADTDKGTNITACKNIVSLDNVMGGSSYVLRSYVRDNGAYYFVGAILTNRWQASSLFTGGATGTLVGEGMTSDITELSNGLGVMRRFGLNNPWENGCFCVLYENDKKNMEIDGESILSYSLTGGGTNGGLVLDCTSGAAVIDNLKVYNVEKTFPVVYEEVYVGNNITSISANTYYAVVGFTNELSDEVITINGAGVEYTHLGDLRYKIIPEGGFDFNCEYKIYIDGKYIGGFILESLLSDDFNDGVSGWQNASSYNGALKIPAGAKVWYDGSDIPYAKQSEWSEYTVELEVCKESDDGTHLAVCKYVPDTNNINNGQSYIIRSYYRDNGALYYVAAMINNRNQTYSLFTGGANGTLVGIGLDGDTSELSNGFGILKRFGQTNPWANDCLCVFYEDGKNNLDIDGNNILSKKLERSYDRGGLVFESVSGNIIVDNLNVYRTETILPVTYEGYIFSEDALYLCFDREMSDYALSKLNVSAQQNGTTLAGEVFRDTIKFECSPKDGDIFSVVLSGDGLNNAEVREFLKITRVLNDDFTNDVGGWENAVHNSSGYLEIPANTTVIYSGADFDRDEQYELADYFVCYDVKNSDNNFRLFTDLRGVDFVAREYNAYFATMLCAKNLLAYGDYFTYLDRVRINDASYLENAGGSIEFMCSKTDPVFTNRFCASVAGDRQMLCLNNDVIHSRKLINGDICRRQDDNGDMTVNINDIGEFEFRTTDSVNPVLIDNFELYKCEKITADAQLLSVACENYGFVASFENSGFSTPDVTLTRLADGQSIPVKLSSQGNQLYIKPDFEAAGTYNLVIKNSSGVICDKYFGAEPNGVGIKELGLTDVSFLTTYKTDGVTVYNSEIINPSLSDIVAFVAFYDENSKLIDIRTHSGTGDFIDIQGSEELGDVYKTSVYVLSNDGKYVPYCKNSSIVLSQSGFGGYNTDVVNSNKTVLYVAPNGNDNAIGSMDAPLATIVGARDRLRAIKKNGKLGAQGATVYFREGEYSITETVLFTNEDSGTLDAPITYCAYNGEDVSFSGGVYIPYKSFVTTTDTDILDQLIEESAKSKVKQVNLFEHGYEGELTHLIARTRENNEYIPEKTLVTPVQLYVGDTMMQLARYPNGDEQMTMSKLVKLCQDTDYWLERFYNHPKFIPADKRDPTDPLIFVPSDDRYLLWPEDSGEGILRGTWGVAWSTNDLLFTVDKENGQISSKYPIMYASNDLGPDKSYFYALNFLCELDAEYEYYVDGEGNFYCILPDTASDEKIFLATCADDMIALDEGCEHLIFKNLDFLKSVGKSVRMRNNSANNLIYGCSNYFNGGISINGTNNGIKNCELHSGNIILSDGDDRRLIPAGNYVENCNITSPDDSYAVSISGGVGNRISHCEIHSCDSVAAGVFGKKHIFEYNDIYDVCRNTSDAGAVYGTGMSKGGVADRGNIFRYNYIHDINSENAIQQGVCGIYNDDCSSGNYITGNIVEGINNGNGWGVLLGGSSDTVVSNNIFVNLSYGAVFGDRASWPSVNNPDNSIIISNLNTTNKGYFRNKWWRAEFPELYERYNVIDEETFDEAWNCKKTSNIYYNVGGDSIASSFKYLTDEDNYETDTDPGFIDAENGNYLLNSSSKVFSQTSFEQIPVEKIGRYYKKQAIQTPNTLVFSLTTPYVWWKGKSTLIDNDINFKHFMTADMEYLPFDIVVNKLGDSSVYTFSPDSHRAKKNGEDIILKYKPVKYNQTLYVSAEDIESLTGFNVQVISDLIFVGNDSFVDIDANVLEFIANELNIF